MVNSIEEAFNGIPVDHVLEIAGRIRAALQTSPTLIQLKDKKEYVTQADIQIQQYLLNYFINSPLAGTYIIKAEEELSQEEQKQNRSNCQFQLIIDPLDGTSAFCNGEETWGSMVGLCDQEGRIIYSWNLISNGEIFSSNTAKLNRNIYDWNAALQSKGLLSIDVYDYGAGAADRFPKVFESKTSGKVSPKQIQVTSYPAAVWAGWGLYNGQLNGLLWLPSDQGKCSYPDYDLTVLGALKEQGWKIAIGKQDNVVLMIVVAPSEDEMKILWETGISMIAREIASSLVCDRDLRITAPVGVYGL